MSPSVSHVYHLISESDWRAISQKTHYSPESLAKEGFIHFSLPPQLAGVVSRFYSGCKDLLVLKIDVSKVPGEFIFEEADGSQYPHLYQPLNLDAVVDVQSWEKVKASLMIGKNA